MKKFLICIYVLLTATLCYAAPDYSGVKVGVNNDLVIPGLLSVPAPEGNWEWDIGDVVEKDNMTVRSFFCEKSGTEVLYTIFVVTCPDEALAYKKSYLEGFEESIHKNVIRNLKSQGFTLTKSEVTDTVIPAPGYTLFEYQMKNGEDSFLSLAFIRPQKHAVWIQYIDTTLEHRDHFIAFANSLKLTRQPSNDSSTEESSSLDISRKIGESVGSIFLLVIVVVIIKKIRKKK